VTGERKHAGVIRKYGLNMSRQAFREKAADIGFVKVCGLWFERCWAGLIRVVPLSWLEAVEGRGRKDSRNDRWKRKVCCSV
jgi:hypothetical protein